VVLVIDEPATATGRVYVLPITHSRPTKGVEAIEIPAAVSRKAGLDAASSWVILSEFNEFVWPGFDLALIPGRNPPTVAYGYLTQASSPSCAIDGLRSTPPPSHAVYRATSDISHLHDDRCRAGPTPSCRSIRPPSPARC
ncbi:MAG: hypothetical protein WAN86_04140, partial [Hyphomicrobiaceae bacterium]